MQLQKRKKGNLHRLLATGYSLLTTGRSFAASVRPALPALPTFPTGKRRGKRRNHLCWEPLRRKLRV